MKKISKKAKRRLIIFGTISVVMIGYFLATTIGYTINYISLKKEEQKLQNELTLLNEQRVNLKTEIEKLNDPEYVARFAKENYLYSTDGEYIIKLDKKSPIETEPTKNYTYFIYVGGVIVLLVGILLVKKKD